MLSTGKSSLPAARADQATRLRQLVRGGVPAQTIAITSGKGGVGKSNVAVNLAISLAGRGVRVTLVDVDLGLANADLLMNIHPRYTLAHVLSGARGIDEVLIEGPGGIRFVPGASGLHEMADLAEFDRAALIAQLHNLEINTDMIILDCGAGLSRNVTGFALAADQVLVVTTPQPTALTDAYATIKALTRERYPGRIGLFVNMARTRADAVATYNRVTEVAQRFLNYSIANCGYMLHDTAVELAVQERCPFVVRFPGSNASACIAAVASEFAKASQVREPRGGFFRRVVGLFV